MRHTVTKKDKIRFVSQSPNLWIFRLETLDLGFGLTICLSFAGSSKVHRIINHPVHIIDEDGELSPTALIPFCEFAGNMSVMGVKSDQFDVPVCNSFRPKVIRDQLCYTVDPNEYKYKIDLKGELSLALFIHYNEDRQMENINTSDEHSIIVDTTGKFFFAQFRII